MNTAPNYRHSPSSALSDHGAGGRHNTYPSTPLLFPTGFYRSQRHWYAYANSRMSNSRAVGTPRRSVMDGLLFSSPITTRPFLRAPSFHSSCPGTRIGLPRTPKTWLHCVPLVLIHRRAFHVALTKVIHRGLGATHLFMQTVMRC